MNSPETPTSLDKQQTEQTNHSLSKKRRYADAFGERDYDVERYGQEIGDNFFERNVGHGIYNKK